MAATFSRWPPVYKPISTFGTEIHGIVRFEWSRCLFVYFWVCWNGFVYFKVSLGHQSQSVSPSQIQDGGPIFKMAAVLLPNIYFWHINSRKCPIWVISVSVCIFWVGLCWNAFFYCKNLSGASNSISSPLKNRRWRPRFQYGRRFTRQNLTEFTELFDLSDLGDYLHIFWECWNIFFYFEVSEGPIKFNHLYHFNSLAPQIQDGYHISRWPPSWVFLDTVSNMSRAYQSINLSFWVCEYAETYFIF
jgi:hypothetical protein